MPTLTVDQIADLVTSTQDDYVKEKLVDLTSDLQDHVAWSHFMKKGGKEVEGLEDGEGTGIQWNALETVDGNARNVGIMSVDNLDQVDGLLTMRVPWRHTQTGYAIDEIQLAVNDSKGRIQNFSKVKSAQMYGGLAPLMESNFWGEIAASTDITTPWGVKCWITYNATSGFNGGDNTKFPSGIGGVSRTGHDRLKNYTFQYTNVSKEDLVRSARRAMWSCSFRSAIGQSGVGLLPNGLPRYGMYTTYDVVQTMEEMAESQNDNLGPDVAKMDGMVRFRRIDVEAIPYLQTYEAAADPFLGLDWKSFRPKALKGQWLKMSPLHRDPKRHRVFQQFLDCTYNFACFDPRRCFLGAKTSWHSS